MNHKFRIICACTLVALLITGCGLKRGLSLPKHPRDQTEQSEPAPAAPAQTPGMPADTGNFHPTSPEMVDPAGAR